MKLRTNFAYPFDQWMPLLIGGCWTAVALSLFLGAWLLGAGAGLNQGAPRLQSQLEAFRKNPVESPRGADSPSPSDMEGLRRRLREFNGLQAGGGETSSCVLSRLEKLLPPGARLQSFQQDQGTGEIQLVVQSEALEDLSRFLASLEGEAAFTKVTLTKQTRLSGGGNWIEFSIDLAQAAR